MLIKQIWCMECKRGSIKYDFRKNAKQEVYCDICGCKHTVRPYKNGRVTVRKLIKEQLKWKSILALEAVL